MIVADSSKAFGTVSYWTILQKANGLGFSKLNLYRVTKHLYNHCQFVQIDDQMSVRAPLHFGVEQGSILGTLLFIIYAFHLHDCLDDSISRYQYTEDMTMYKHCVVKDLSKSMVQLNSTLDSLGRWPFRSNPSHEKLRQCRFQPVNSVAYTS